MSTRTALFSAAVLAAGVIATVGALLVADPAHATTVPPIALPELVARADVIVRVHIIAKKARWEGGRIITLHDASVIEVLKAPSGAPPPRVVVGLPGGLVGDLGQVVPGTPVLDVGGEYLLFLSAAVGPEAWGQGARATLGLWEGVLRVVEGGGPGGTGAVLLPFDHAGPSAGAPPFDLAGVRMQVKLAQVAALPSPVSPGGPSVSPPPLTGRAP